MRDLRLRGIPRGAALAGRHHVLAAVAAVLVAGGGAALLVASRSPRAVGPSDAAPAVVSAPPVSSLSSTTPERSATAIASKSPSPSVPEVRVDELPAASTAATTTWRPPPSTPAPAAAIPSRAPSMPSCNPPYTFDDQGNKKFKRECLR